MLNFLKVKSPHFRSEVNNLGFCTYLTHCMEVVWKNESIFEEVYEEERSEMLNIQSFAGTIDTDMSTEDVSYYHRKHIPMVFQGSSHKSELGSKMFGDLPKDVYIALKDFDITAQDFENTIGLIANSLVKAWKGNKLGGY